MNNRTLNNLEIANANTKIKEFSNSNPNLTKCSSNFSFREISIEIYFLVKLTFAYYESDV